MAGTLNKVILIGRLGADPEIKQMVNGKSVARLSLATNQNWKDKNTGEKKEKTEWHRVVVFNEGLIGVVENYIKKGTKLYIEGALQTRKWTDDKGIEKYTTEIVIQGYGGRIDIVSAKGNNQELSQDQDVSESADVSNKETVSKENIKKNTDDKSDTSIDEEDIPF